MSSQQNPVDRMEFKAELKQLLDLIIHSLYTRKEIFLRELISNAADAIDKARFEGLRRPELLEGDSAWRIRIVPDEKAGTLTLSDNGIGMSRQTIVEDLGTIARSGTRAFLENLKKTDEAHRPELIGQFGVGFYASFMAADRVTVASRAAGPGNSAVKWESDGQGQFTVEPADKPSRGTDVILHLRDDAREFLQPYRLRDIVKRYSDFIEHPIVLVTEKDGKPQEETLNSRQAIWLRPKGEIKPQEYNEFYRQVSRDSADPATVVHIAAEGTMEFRALLFIPSQRPLDFLWREPKAGLDLYVRRVLIMHSCEELLPPWLRFVKGVVDSSDLPLNVSREMLQHNPILSRIRSNLVNRVLKTLEQMKQDEYEKYLAFNREFGAILKEGITQDFSNRDRLADLLLLPSLKTDADKFTTLAKYVEAMPPDQAEILYLTGETREMLASSPYLESARARGHDVLLLTEPIDEFVMQSLDRYKDKPLRPVDRTAAEPPSDSQKQAEEAFKALLTLLKEKLPEVQDVRLSTRLKESAACLVADEHGVSAHMERILQRLGRADEVAGNRRILELNASHPAVAAIRKLHDQDPADERVVDYARLLLDQAVLAEGSKPKDPASLARRINDLLLKALQP